MTQKELWNKIKLAEDWLNTNYGTHPQTLEAPRRYEVLCDEYEERFNVRPFQKDFTTRTGFSFENAKYKLKDKLPLLNKLPLDN